MAKPATLIVLLLKAWMSPREIEYQPGERLRLPTATAEELVSKGTAEPVTTTCVRFRKHGTDNLKRAYEPGSLANIPQEYANRLLAEKPSTVEQVTESELVAWETAQAEAEAKAAKAAKKEKE